LTAKITDQNGASATDSINITTKAGDTVTISGLSISGISASSATITFQTDKQCDSSVKIGTDPNNLADEKFAGLMTQSHSLQLVGLVSKTKYYFAITATTDDGLTSTTTGSFTTL
jgi:ABC-type microcin C transport system duplicated ATPase subunit YejF